ncbi:hypothetical protein [Mesorhizobium sp. LjNodule214]|uniref:hypothetical protein n=1 Tax=Mesorhizobium sp. LjNodule214 TaxID=3342252 RepID=UPI003ED0E2C4
MLDNIVAWFKAMFRERHQTHALTQRGQAKKDKSFYRTLAIDGKRHPTAREEQAKMDKKDRD